jgi:hypothetical protein
MKTKKEKLWYIALIVLDVLAILWTWNYMTSALKKSIAIARGNPFSDTAVYGFGVAMLAAVFSPIALMLELVMLVYLIGEVLG